MTEPLTRSELHDLVWSTPLYKIAQDLNRSSPTVSKACMKYNIPVPPRGYWNKVSAGHKTSKRTLPKRSIGVSDRVTFGSQWWYHNGLTNHDLLTRPTPPRPIFEPSMDEIYTQATALISKSSFPKSLTRPFSLINKLLVEDEKRRIKVEESKWSSYEFQPIFVTQFERRRLKILNALFTGLLKCGMKPECDKKEGRDTCIVVGTQRVFFTLDSMNLRKDQLQGSGHYGFTRRGPKDKMFLKLGHHYTQKDNFIIWEDDSAGKIEDKIVEIAIEIIVHGERSYREDTIRQYDWNIERKRELEEKRKRRIIKERRERDELRQKLAQGRVDHLLLQAHNFRQANDIRAFVATMQNFDQGTPETISQGELQDWSSWALNQANDLDPVTSGQFSTKPKTE